MAKKPPRPLADDELLRARERSFLNSVAGWYRNSDWGFYSRIVWYSYISIKPFFVGPIGLEMGPADGGMTRLLKDDFEHLTIVDASTDYIRAAEEIGTNVTGHVSLFEEFDPPERYDTIIMSHVLEHVRDPVSILTRATSWLNPRGRIITVVPNAESLHRRLGVKLGLLKRVTELNEQDTEIGHRRVYTRAELDRDIQSAGLYVVAKGGIFLKLFSNSQMLTFDDSRLIDGMFELGKDLPELCSEIYAVCVGDR